MSEVEIRYRVKGTPVEISVGYKRVNGGSGFQATAGRDKEQDHYAREEFPVHVSHISHEGE